MCGIAGLLRLTPTHSLEQDMSRVNDALHSMRHRGPDRSAVIQSSGLTLGHNRLSIIDISAAGNQPMWDPSYSYAIAFNGEIFNYRALQHELRERGVEFQSNSDTEVLLHWLIQFGENGLTRLNGFFAFAFWNSTAEQLLVVRDRFGEKPLWYFQTDDQIAFASEGKALQHLTEQSEIDPASVATFLQYTYIPAPYSIWKNHIKLQPGQLICITKGEMIQRRWYESPVTAPEAGHEAIQLRELLQDAVQLRLISDVPLGAFLSGGLDSSIVAALAAQSVQTLRTYSISFPDSPFLDEREDAERVARHIGSVHESIAVRDAELFDAFSDTITALDEPFSDASAVAVNALSKAVKQNVTVALSGDGADEIFGGYRKHLALMRATQSTEWHKSFIQMAATLSSALPSGRQSKLANNVRKLRKYARGLSLNNADRYLYWSSFSGENHVREILDRSVIQDSSQRMQSFIGEKSMDTLSDCLRTDQELVLANDMLVKVDLMSMSHSLEIRSPFLDHRVVEWARGLNDDHKIHQGIGKHILREAFGALLPSSTLIKEKKGFEIPLDSWLRSRLSEEVQGLADSSVLRHTGLFRMDGIKSLISRWERRPDSSLTHLLFSLLVLNRWLERRP